MANIKSQIKRIKTNENRRLRNQSILSKIKTYTSKLNQALEAKDKEAAEKLLKTTVITLDKAVSDGIIHRNNAANKKSSMMRKYHLLINVKREEPSADETKPSVKPAKKTPAKKSPAKPKAKKA